MLCQWILNKYTPNYDFITQTPVKYGVPQASVFAPPLFIVCKEHTQWIRVLEKLVVAWLFKKLHAMYWTPRFIIIFTRACHWRLSLAKWIRSATYHTVSLRFFLILSYHLHLGLASGLCPLVFLAKILWTFFSSMHASCSARLILLDLVTLIFGEP